MLKWKDTYSVGYELFDEQHKELIGMINEIGELVKDKELDTEGLYESMTEVIGRLLNYTVYHFGAEEGIFDKNNYELTKEHKEAHAIFVENVKVLVSDLDENEDVKSVAFEIYETLVEWLLKHILDVDKKYMNQLTI